MMFDINSIAEQMTYLLFDILSIIIFFRGLPDKKTSITGRMLSLMPFLLFLPQYLFAAQIISITYRFLIRLIVNYFYLRLQKQTERKESIYLALISHIIYTSWTVIFMTPLLFPARKIILFPNHLLINGIVRAALVSIPLLLLMEGMQRLIKPNTIAPFHIGRMSLLLVFNLMEQILKHYSYLITRSTPSDPLELTIYASFFQISMLAVLYFLEMHGKQVYDNEKNILAAQAREYEIENLQTQIRASDQIRSLSHDMRNHLIALEALSDDPKGLKSYLSALLEESDVSQQVFHTGNKILDGLLDSKQTAASALSIQLKVQLQASLLSFLSMKDLCTIFGNAIDNAIESCAKIENVNERIIHISNRSLAGNLIIQIKNPCTEEVTFRNGLPQSTKSDSIQHGIGSFNIARTVEKYGGMVYFDTSEQNKYKLKILIPLPKEKLSEEKDLSVLQSAHITLSER